MSKNKKQQAWEHRWSMAKEAHAVLRALHPVLFDLEQPVPFKIGLGENIAAIYRDLDQLTVGVMFQWLSSRKAYLLACTPGTERHGVDGPDGTVSEKEAAFAKAKYDRRVMLDEINAANRKPREAAA